jgi:AhpD family alkylhydroperoxidase
MPKDLDPLAQEYGELPPWAAALDGAAPDAYQAYLALRGTVLRDGVLSRKEKDLLLVGVNAARRYRPSLLGHTRLAVQEGATPEEVLEAVLVGILSRGIPAWMEGLEAVELAERHAGRKARLPEAGDAADDAQPGWLAALHERAPAAGDAYRRLRATLLLNGQLPRLFRELVLVGINLSEGYEPGVRLHAGNARRFGADDRHLVETALTMVLTAGIPAWFGIVPHLERCPGAP